MAELLFRDGPETDPLSLITAARIAACADVSAPLNEYLRATLSSGRCRRVNNSLDPINTAGVVYGTGWETNTYNGIVPRSVWTIKHRPKHPGTPEGMVYAGGGDWVDIYLVGPGGVSAHGVMPLSGTEGHNYLSFSDLALKVGKKMMSYNLWLRAAYGSPQGNDADNLHAWTRTTNAGRALTGATNAAGNATGTEAKLHAVSSIGCVDCVGNLWEWLDEVMNNADGGRVFRGSTDPAVNPLVFATWDGGRFGLEAPATGTGHGTLTRPINTTLAPVHGTYAWDPVSPLGDTVGGNPNNGGVHQCFDLQLTALLAGAVWAHGARAGCRALHATLHGLWAVTTLYGSRFACDSL